MAKTRRKLEPPRTSSLPKSGNSSKRVWLERALSKKGLATRTEARALILSGRISVQGKVILDPRRWVDLEKDVIAFNDQVVEKQAERIIVLFHKPRGVVTTKRDEKNRKTIYDVLPENYQSLIAVGRLDQATSGLLVLTNDREWASDLLDPKNKVERVYLVEVSGAWSDQKSRNLMSGVSVTIEGIPCVIQAQKIEAKKVSNKESQIIVTLTQGKNREIRRLVESQGLEVNRLKRLSFGEYELGELKPGECLKIQP
jgi:23S rRNA pseudouridine2605 synthase